MKNCTTICLDAMNAPLETARKFWYQNLPSYRYIVEGVSILICIQINYLHNNVLKGS